MATITERFGFTKPAGSDPASIVPLNSNTDLVELYLGRTQDMIAPMYDDTATYEVDDIVTYESKLYKCITAISTAETFDPTKWEETTAVQEGSGGGGGGTEVIANPTGTPTDTLNTIDIDGVIYDIEGSGGGGGEIRRDYYLDNGLIADNVDDYIWCNLDKELVSGKTYIIVIKDDSYTYYKEVEWTENTTVTINADMRLGLEQTRAGLTYYSGSHRKIYCDIYVYESTPSSTDGGIKTVRTPINNTDSSESINVNVGSSFTSETVDITHFVKDLAGYQFSGSSSYTSNTVFNSYNNGILNISWDIQSGTSRQFFNIGYIDDLADLVVLSDWTRYDTDGTYEFVIPSEAQDLTVEDFYIDFRNVKTGGATLELSSVIKTIENGKLKVTFPFPSGQTVYMECRILYALTGGGIQPVGVHASDIEYDNTTSQLTATNVQDALDEVVGRVSDAEGDITQLNSSLTNTNLLSIQRVALTKTTDSTGNIALSYTNDGFTYIVGAMVNGSHAYIRAWVSGTKWHLTAVAPNTGVTINNTTLEIRFLVVKIKTL